MIQRETDQNQETTEDLGRGGYRLIQSRKGFRFGEDTVLLAYFADRVIGSSKGVVRCAELGANSGAASVLLAARNSRVRIDAAEILPAAYARLTRNITLNALEDRIFPFCMDLRTIRTGDDKCWHRTSYDVVFFNPPYRAEGRGPTTTRESEGDELRLARFEVNGGVKDFLAAAEYLLTPGGHCVLVHRASRLPEVLSEARALRLEPELLRMVHAKADQPAKTFLLSLQKHRKTGGFQAGPPLLLRDDKGAVSKERTEIYSEEAK